MMALLSCQPQQSTAVQAMTLEQFTETYNDYIAKWLDTQAEELEAKLEKNPEDQTLLDRLKVIKERQDLEGYFVYKSELDLPANLKWYDGLEHPEIGDSKAQKGGVINRYESSFPNTIRAFGSQANSGGYRDLLYDDVGMSLIGLHPENGEVIPALADRWAVTEDGKTVVFHIDQDATFHDGVKVTARDFPFGVFVRISDYVNAPYAKTYFREQFAQICTYGEEYVSVTLPKVRPMQPYFCSLSPAPSHFYNEYGPDFEERYQWRFIPTTGAYKVEPQDIVKGVSITQTRVLDWWAKDKKYYRYRFNPDAVVTKTIREDSKAFELFRAGQIDYFMTTRPELWYEKTEIPEVFKGYIEKSVFYNEYPRRPYGFYLNLSRPKLQDLNFRIGVHHAMNWKKVIDVNLTGAFMIARGAFNLMREQDPQGGRIINNGSVSAYVPRWGSAPYTVSKHAITGLTRTLSLDGRPFGIACGQIDIGNAATPMVEVMKTGVPQPDGSIRAEATMDVDHVGSAVAYMASLPLDANVLTMTIMANQMPFVGRG